MRPHFSFWTLSLLVVFTASSCAPAATRPPAAMEATIFATAAPVETSLPETTVAAPTQSVVVQAVATSRGADLEATDPATVNLASGGLQVVEFFRFT